MLSIKTFVKSRLFKNVVYVLLFANTVLALEGCSRTIRVPYEVTEKVPQFKTVTKSRSGESYEYFFKNYNKPILILFTNKESNSLVSRLQNSKEALKNFNIIPYSDALETARALNISLNNISNRDAKKLNEFGIKFYTSFKIRSDGSYLLTFNKTYNNAYLSLTFKDSYNSTAITDAVKFFETFRDGDYYSNEVVDGYKTRTVTKYRNKTEHSIVPILGWGLVAYLVYTAIQSVKKRE